MRRKKVVSTVNLSICSSFLQVNGHQIMAGSCLVGTLKTSRKVNGYRADYAIQRNPAISSKVTKKACKKKAILED